MHAEVSIPVATYVEGEKATKGRREARGAKRRCTGLGWESDSGGESGGESERAS